MKKFFTLFALLSVGLSAWAQEYVLTRNDGEFSETMKANGDGTYSLRKLFYLTNGNSEDPWFDPEDPEYESEEGNDTEYVFWVGDICRASFWMGNGSETGWYDLTFTFDPSIPVVEDEGPLTITVNEGTIEVSEGNLGQTETTIHFTDDLSFAIEGTFEQELEGVSIIYTRSGCNQWGTLCLPFNFLPEKQENVTFYQLESVTDGAMIFTPLEEEELCAGNPVVFKLDEGIRDLVVSDFGAYPNIASEPEPSYSDDDWTMYGTFETVNSGSNTYYFIANHNGEEGVFYGTNITIPPYRAWFTAPDDYNSAPLRISIDDTEGLQFVEQEDGTVKVCYDLQGCKLDEAQKGLKIENGKVIMVK